MLLPLPSGCSDVELLGFIIGLPEPRQCAQELNRCTKVGSGRSQEAGQWGMSRVHEAWSREIAWEGEWCYILGLGVRHDHSRVKIIQDSRCSALYINC